MAEVNFGSGKLQGGFCDAPVKRGAGKSKRAHVRWPQMPDVQANTKEEPIHASPAQACGKNKGAHFLLLPTAKRKPRVSSQF